MCVGGWPRAVHKRGFLEHHRTPSHLRLAIVSQRSAPVIMANPMAVANVHSYRDENPSMANVSTGKAAKVTMTV